MFDFSSGELLLIAVAVLIFIKPKDLPAVLRTVGQWTGKLRRMAGEFQDQFREAMREAEMAEIKRDIEEATSKVGTGPDPFADIKQAVEWTPPTAGSAPPPADAPPAPPAEAIVAEPTAPASPALEPTTTSAVAVEPAAPTDHVTPAPPPAGGDRAA